MSSAYKRILLEIQSGMSLTKQKNNKEPKTVPCGTPEVTGRDSLESNHLELVTCWDLFEMKSLIQSSIGPHIPYSSVYSSVHVMVVT